MKRTLCIRRGAGTAARYETFQVDLEASATLLDALEFLRIGAAKDLAYRHSCHHGSCGTCAVRVDGKEVLACLTPLDSLYRDGESELVPTVDPLRTFEPIGDLVVDPERLFNSMPEETAKLRDSEWVDGVRTADSRLGGNSAEGGVRPSGIDRFVRFEDCIECGACMSACPVTVPFLGPAVLAALRRETINRPERQEELLRIASRPDGAAACERHFACSRVCPRYVYPGKHIELLRKEIEARNR